MRTNSKKGFTLIELLVVIAIIAILMGMPMDLEIILCLIMFGSTLGFLVHNFYPAKIFMGDSGSMFLGYIISIICNCIQICKFCFFELYIFCRCVFNWLLCKTSKKNCIKCG